MRSVLCTPKSPIAPLNAFSLYKTDLIRYLLGEDIVEVAGFVESSAKEGTDIDDNATCILKSDSGIIGTLAASWSYNTDQDNSAVIYAEKAILRLEDDPDYALIVQ